MIYFDCVFNLSNSFIASLNSIVSFVSSNVLHVDKFVSSNEHLLLPLIARPLTLQGLLYR